MPDTELSLRERFERLDLSAEEFAHSDHVKVAFEMLGKYDFLDACSRFATTIRIMADAAGVPEKFNVTITIAFFGLIAERMCRADAMDYDGFIAANRDLTHGRVLENWYSSERLNSALARGTFLLPDMVQGRVPGCPADL